MIKHVIPLFVFLSIPFIFSCSDDEPTDYYTVDGTKYELSIATISPDAYPATNHGGFNLFDTEVVLTSKSAFFISVTVMSRTLDLKEGTYHFNYEVNEYEQNPGDLSYFRVMYGGVDNELLGDSESEGTLVVERNGDKYTFDINGTIEGHAVTAHYQGEVHIWSPS